MQRECDLSIITINYNGINDTCKLIGSIPCENISTEVIVVDNASTKDEASELERLFPNIIVVRSNKNLGFAGGNNLGIKHSCGKYLFFVNNDTEFCSSSIGPLIRRMESNDKIGIVCPKIRFFDGAKFIQYAGYTPLSRISLRNRAIGYGEKDQGQYNQAHPTPYAHGAAMLVRRKAIEKAGMMPECYFLYYEELDWSVMMRRAGYDIWYEPLTTIYHKESQSTGRNSPLKSYYMSRNRLMFARRNNNTNTKWISYAYISLAIIVKDVVGNLTHREYDLAFASMQGLVDFLLRKTCKKE